MENLSHYFIPPYVAWITELYQQGLDEEARIPNVHGPWTVGECATLAALAVFRLYRTVPLGLGGLPYNQTHMIARSSHQPSVYLQALWCTGPFVAGANVGMQCPLLFPSPPQSANDHTLFYHGTQASSADWIRTNGVDLAEGVTKGDFTTRNRRGYYVSTKWSQAVAFAKEKVQRDVNAPDPAVIIDRIPNAILSQHPLLNLHDDDMKAWQQLVRKCRTDQCHPRPVLEYNE